MPFLKSLGDLFRSYQDLMEISIDAAQFALIFILTRSPKDLGRYPGDLKRSKQASRRSEKILGGSEKIRI